jgi:ABC-2 type transport system permease protein
LAALRNYRELVLELASRNIKTRYKRSMLGVAWTMLNPLLIMLIMTMVFANVLRANVDNYAVFLLSALLLWNFFSQTATSVATEIVWGGALLSRIYIPPSAFAVSALGAGLVNATLSLVPLLLVMAVTGVPITASVLFAPIGILAASMFALGVGLAIARLAMNFRDVIDMFQISTVAWMYVTPVIYPAQIIPEEFAWIIAYNPMTLIIEIFRTCFLAGTMPAAEQVVVSLAVGAVSLVLGWIYFCRGVHEFPYQV